MKTISTQPGIKSACRKFIFLSLLLCSTIVKSYATAWTTSVAGDITNLANWTDGTTSPTDFTTPGDTWTVNLAMTMVAPSLWTLGTASTAPVTLTINTGGSLALVGGFGSNSIEVYGNVVMNGGGQIQATGTFPSADINVYGNYDIINGIIDNTTGSGSVLDIFVYGNYTMTDGSVNTGGFSSQTTFYIEGNFNVSGPAAMTNTGAATGCLSLVYLELTTSVMAISNTSTGTWSETDVIVDFGCTAQLSGNFNTTTGSSINGLTVYGKLICPAADTVIGTGTFALGSGAALTVAHATGIDGAITTTGPISLTNDAEYEFNGSVPQVTGINLPNALVPPSILTINNSAGVTLSQSTSTTDVLALTNGILNTGSFTMTTSGSGASVTGASATSYVNGTLIKEITGFVFIYYEVGDINYAPMYLTFTGAGTAGALGVKVTNGLHPSIASSGVLSSNVVNHYWTTTNYGAAGPTAISPTATYNVVDIIGGSNTTFVTQVYSGSAWLASALATTNTTAPYTSQPVTGGSVIGDFIFGDTCSILPITGPATVCAGATITLSDATPAGVWTSSNTSIATVSATGDVTGVAAGFATISYTTSCSVTLPITVGTLPISGITTICTGSVASLSDATPGGVWSSDNSAVATVSVAGNITGGVAGTANISYTVGSCTPEIVVVTVADIAPITGTLTFCSGSTTALSDITPGGAWTSDNTTVATVSATGTVTGVSAGTANISYATGVCTTSAAIVVGTLPITGSATACVGSTIPLSNATPGGVWTSSNTTFATVSSSGVVTGIAAGTIDISYTLGSCPAVTWPMTVIDLSPIAGTTAVCSGSTTSLSEAATGGAWSSSNTSIATVSGLGVVSGVSGGVADISYTSGACFVTASVTVTSLSSISGVASMCTGATTTLSNAVPGGVWSSDNSAVATVSSTGVVSGASAGTANISYSYGPCSAGVAVSVITLTGITGTTAVCAGSTTALSNSTGGGAWSSDNTGVATVSATGVVSGVSAGPANISYTVGGCSVGTGVTVTSLSTISGSTSFCTGSTTTLSNSTTGGVWSSDNTAVATVSVTGVVSGVSGGTANISYSSGPCITGVAVTVITIAPITGSTNVCAGSTISLTDPTSGGAWSSSNPGVATVSATGVVSGVIAGTTTISYAIGGCSTTSGITVYTPPAITGITTVCTGATTTLSNPLPGGTWSSGTLTVATVGATGIVTGVAVGSSTISYAVTGCLSTTTVTVNAGDAGTITGPDTVCVGNTISMSDNVPGGTWSSTNVSRATVDASGVVTGVSIGIDTIVYTITNSCGTFTAKHGIYVRTAVGCVTNIDPIPGGEAAILKIFPNPNSGSFTLSLMSGPDEDVQVVITNIVGEKVKEINAITNKEVNIKLEPTPGMYFISVSTAHSKYTAKVVVY